MSQSLLKRRVPSLTTFIAAVLATGATVPADGAYNSNISGTPTAVIAYEGGAVLFSLNTQPATNGTCNAAYFEIDVANNTDAVLGRMYARLLLAYTQQQAVLIGYDNSGACGTSGYIHAYRVG